MPFLACAVQGVFWEYLQPYVWFLFFPTAYCCAYFGGLRGGLTSTVISALLVWYVFIPPQFSFALPRPSSLFSIVVFVIMGALFGVAHERLARARRLSAEAQALAEQRAREAETANRRVAEEVAARVRVEKDVERSSAELAERKAHEREIERWTRLYAALSQINQAIVRMKTPEDLAREVSRAAVEFGGFKLAWIGRHHAENGEMLPVGWAGEPVEFISHFHHGSEEDGSHRCPCGPTIRNDRAYVLNDLSAEPEMPDWKSRMAAAGIQAAAVLPIRVQNAVWGVFGVYAGETGIFQDKERALLEQAAMDIGYAIENLEKETHRQQAVEALRQSEARLQFALDTNHCGTWELDLVDYSAHRSLEHDRIFGYPNLLPTWTYEMFLAHVLPEDRREVDAKFHAATSAQQDWGFECRIQRVDGAVRWIWAAGRHILSSTGQARRMAGIVQDITDRKQAEEAVRQSEARLRLSVAAADIGLWDWDLATNQVIFSPEWKRQIGYRDDEIPNRFEEWQSRVHPEDLEPMLEKVRTFLATPQGRHMGEFRFRHKDGSYRWIYTHADVVRDASGQPVRMLGCHVDITARKQAEADLIRMRNTLLEAQEIAHLGSFEYVAATRTTVWSEEEYRIYGLDPAGPSPAYDEMLARCIHPEDAALLHETFTNAMAGQTVYELEHRIVRPDGSVRWVYDRARPYFDAQGKLLRYVGTTLDITDRKQLEERLLESEQRYTLLFQKSSTATVLLRLPEVVIVDINEACEHLLGFTRQEVAGKTAIELGMTKKENRQEAISRFLHHGTLDGHEMHLVTRSGVEKIVVSNTNRVTIAGKPYAITTLQDFTALRHAEAALRRSEAHLRTLVKTLPDLVWVKDPAGVYLSCNTRFEVLFGVAEAAIVGKTDYDFVPREVADAFRRNDAAALAAGRPRINEEEVVFASDGHRELLETIKTPLHDADGTLIGVLGIARDITARKRAEEALRESEARRALALDAAKAGTWEWELASGTNVWSEELWKLYGLDPNSSEASYEAWRQSIHPDERARVEQSLREMVQREAEINLEWRVNDSVGADRWLMSRGRPQRDDTGRVTRYLGVVIEITERKRAEEAARQNEARLNFALQAGHTGAWSLNTRDRTATRTLLHAQIFGYPSADGEWNQEKFLVHVVPEDRETVRQRMQEGLATRTGWSFECRIRRTDGELRWVLIAGGFEPEGSSSRVSGIIQDVTERKQLEQQRTAMEAQLRQQQKLESIGTLASGVAHEINNPISGIMNYAQLIEDRLPPASPLTEFTGEILRETHRVATIVRNLLTFARNEKQTHSPARLVDIVDAVLSLVRTVIRRDQIQLQVNLPENLPLLKCRSQQIQQVIMNLVTNARDALNERYPGADPDKVLNLEARLFEKAGRRWIRLTVEDHGTGIAPEVRERIFDPFFTTKGRGAGTGLGLSISHGIVKEHHGEWTVESDPGRFTRMHVDLPVDNGWNL